MKISKQWSLPKVLSSYNTNRLSIIIVILQLLYEHSLVYPALKLVPSFAFFSYPLFGIASHLIFISYFLFFHLEFNLLLFPTLIVIALAMIFMTTVRLDKFKSDSSYWLCLHVLFCGWRWWAPLGIWGLRRWWIQFLSRIRSRMKVMQCTKWVTCWKCDV